MSKHEIERKFLVHVDRLPPAAHTGGARYSQGYLSFRPSVRVRLSEDDTGDEKAWLTIKGPGKLRRAEFEYEIPADDARDLLALCQASLSKVRRCIPVGGHVWEIDEFAGPHAGLWLAEIELEAEDEPFVRPDWVALEVTDDPRYTNAELARSGRVP